MPHRQLRTEPSSKNERGSILLMVLVFCSFLSVCLLFASNSVLLGTQAQNAFQSSLDLFYIAEAGLAHGRAFCTTHELDEIVQPGENPTEDPDPDSPFHAWTDWGGGRYRLEAFLPMESGPGSVPVRGAPGLLLSVTARLGNHREKSLFLLVEEPPSCRTLSWWEP